MKKSFGKIGECKPRLSQYHIGCAQTTSTAFAWNFHQDMRHYDRIMIDGVNRYAGVFEIVSQCKCVVAVPAWKCLSNIVRTKYNNSLITIIKAPIIQYLSACTENS